MVTNAGGSEAPSASPGARGIEALVREHENLKARSLNLVPTENVLSPAARRLLGSDLAQRYYLTDSTVWEYPQTEVVARITETANKWIGEAFRSARVNSRPISGLNAMTCVVAGLSQPGEVVYSLDPAHGGHGATQRVCAYLGRRWAPLPLSVNGADFDVVQLGKQFRRNPPSLVYIDQSNVLFPLRPDSIADLAHEFGAKLYYDCSQILGLMLDPDYFDPRSLGADAIGGSTHKSFPGPQKAVIFPSVAAQAAVDAAVDTLVSNHHLSNLAALGETAAEMVTHGRAYSMQLRRNSQALAQAMHEEGLPVHVTEKGYTDSHQVWLHPMDEYLDSSRAIAQLTAANIVVNSARLPILAPGTRGIRLGTSEVTRLGMDEKDMAYVGRLIAHTLLRRRSINAIRQTVADMRAKFESIHFWQPDPELETTQI